MKWAKENFPFVKEFFFDDDTFNIQQGRTIELCEKLKPLGITWSCTSRVTTSRDTLKAMKEAGCRLLIVGFESGDPQILKNIKKGATVERAREFVKDCHDLGLIIHADFILGLPGETKESIRNTINFAKTLDCETIQVSRGACVSGHRVLRLRQAQRLHHEREDGRRRRTPDGAHRVSGAADRVRDGDGAQVLRRILLPSEGCVPRGVEGCCESRCAAALCRGEGVHEAAVAAEQGVAGEEGSECAEGSGERQPECITAFELEGGWRTPLAAFLFAAKEGVGVKHVLKPSQYAILVGHYAVGIGGRLVFEARDGPGGRGECASPGIAVARAVQSVCRYWDCAADWIFCDVHDGFELGGSYVCDARYGVWVRGDCADGALLAA